MSADGRLVGTPSAVGNAALNSPRRCGRTSVEGTLGLVRLACTSTIPPLLCRAPAVACELRPARYDLIMKAFGGEGETIGRLDQVGPAVGRALASGPPYCHNVKIRWARSPFTEWRIARKKK